MRVNYSKDKDLFGFKYAFYKHTRLSVLEKIKNKKKFSENNLYHRAKFFRKNFFTKKSRNDSVAAGRGKGGGGLYSTQQANTGAKRT